MSIEFEAGDVVVLASCSPRMTVEKVDGENISCVWFTDVPDLAVQRGIFKAACLREPAS